MASELARLVPAGPPGARFPNGGCRAFFPTPVSLATVREILELAARAPSGGNLQPWRVHALAGAVLADLEVRIRPHAPARTLSGAPAQGARVMRPSRGASRMCYPVAQILREPTA
jgi:nitroreductase